MRKKCKSKARFLNIPEESLESIKSGTYLKFTHLSSYKLYTPHHKGTQFASFSETIAYNKHLPYKKERSAKWSKAETILFDYSEKVDLFDLSFRKIRLFTLITDIIQNPIVDRDQKIPIFDKYLEKKIVIPYEGIERLTISKTMESKDCLFIREASRRDLFYYDAKAKYGF